jgi:hypothetical protein
MPGDIPRKPAGSSAEARFARSVYEQTFKERKSGNVQGHRASGKLIVPSRVSGGGGATVEMYVLAEPTDDRPTVVEDDYLVCRTFDQAAFDAGTGIADEDGVVEGIGTEDTYVAKQYKHRCSITEEKILGTAYTYTYYDDTAEDTPYQNTLRDAEDEDENVETQRIVPPWIPSRTEGDDFIPGDIIYAIETTGTGVLVDTEEVTLLDCCSSRQWARTWASTFGA